jgi:hypothetical protein
MGEGCIMRRWEVTGMITAFALLFIGVVCRLLPPYLATWGVNAWNLVPMGAVALYAGSRLPWRVAWLVPLAAMVLSDLVLDSYRHRPLFELSRWVIYATFAATTLLGPLANRFRRHYWLLPLLSLAASLLFFLTSNFAVWAEGHLYPLTVEGLRDCYWYALPFFRQTVLGDLVGTAVLFGVGALIERVARSRARLRLAE